jgi:hypothetical protein
LEVKRAKVKSKRAPRRAAKEEKKKGGVSKLEAEESFVLDR